MQKQLVSQENDTAIRIIEFIQSAICDNEDKLKWSWEENDYIIKRYDLYQLLAKLRRFYAKK